MYRAIHKFAMLASVVVLAAGSTNCGRSGDSESSSSILGPSEAARGGNGRGNKPGGGSSGGSLALVPVNDATGNGAPTWGDTVTFNVSTSATAEPTVSLSCSQNGRVVYGASAGFYASYPWPWARDMELWSGAWTSGAASCTATLFPNGDRGTVLASLTFTAGE